jgi:alpha-L-fucosidase
MKISQRHSGFGKAFSATAEQLRKDFLMPDFRIPENDVHLAQVRAYIENEPLPTYQHAPDSAVEAFLDMKYAVRIHWGLYSMWKLPHESWPFLRLSNRSRQAYQQLYKRFNPVRFDTEAWMAFFERVGLKGFTITTKHHEGFSLFDTRTHVQRRMNWTAPGGPQVEACDLAYSVMDTPFQRDIIRELCDAARRHGMRIDLYFSHPDWYDADFRPYADHPLQTPRVFEHPEEYGTPGYVKGLKPPRNILWTERTEEETARMLQRHRAQLEELLSNYGPIDMLCLDQWLGKDAWPHLRETIFKLREIQPDVMIRIRGIGNYGDYYTPEGVVPANKAATGMPWMVIYPLGRTFSYESIGLLHKGPKWIIHNLIQCTATGGCFMVGIGPDGSGAFHPRALRDLEQTGEWLRVNGEAIYATRPCSPWREGQHVFFSRSKDWTRIYALCTRWPGRELRLGCVPFHAGMQAQLLGAPEAGPLACRQEGEELVVDLPVLPRGLERRLSRYACAFRFEYPEAVGLA